MKGKMQMTPRRSLHPPREGPYQILLAREDWQVWGCVEVEKDYGRAIHHAKALMRRHQRPVAVLSSNGAEVWRALPNQGFMQGRCPYCMRAMRCRDLGNHIRYCTQRNGVELVPGTEYVCGKPVSSKKDSASNHG